jgi:hypothetical protein
MMKIYIFNTSLRGNNCVPSRISWNLFQSTGGQRRNTGKSGRVLRNRDRRPSTTACPGCWAMGTNTEKKCAKKKIIFCAGLSRTANAGQKSNRHDEPNEPTKEEPLSFVLQESSFASVSTVRRATPL